MHTRKICILHVPHLSSLMDKATYLQVPTCFFRACMCYLLLICMLSKLVYLNLMFLKRSQHVPVSHSHLHREQ